jgi:radical SAM superfamily enzyme YgiQ (UPF0313 family)
MPVGLDDRPDLVVIQVYITSARRAYLADHYRARGIIINGSFVFGMDDDDGDVFRRTVDWALEQGMTTATFHIQTPYPGTKLFAHMQAQGRIVTRDWDLYDTRHVVYRPARLTSEALKEGYEWKKFERLWDVVIRARELRRVTPLLEGVLSKVTAVRSQQIAGVRSPQPRFL